jgi:hypothetical protein
MNNDDCIGAVAKLFRKGNNKMRVLTQAEIDAMLAKLLANPTIIPGHENDEIHEEQKSAENA